MLGLNEFIGIVELGMVYSLVAIAIFLSFRVLNFSDLTVDGSFALGSAVFATAMNAQLGLGLAMGLSILAGALAGLASATLAITLGFGDLLGSILVMYALYSINFRIVGSSNLVVNLSGADQHLIFLVGVVAVILCLLFKGLRSEGGLAMRAVGINAQIVTQYGFPLNTLKFSGLALSNALVALGGTLFTLVSGFYDINVGTGTLIVGLASLVIGESLSQRLSLALVLCVAGSLFYRLAIHMGFHAGTLGLVATDLNIITALLIIGFVLSRKLRGMNLGVPHVKL